jgi:hypothetical protein
MVFPLLTTYLLALEFHKPSKKRESKIRRLIFLYFAQRQSGKKKGHIIQIIKKFTVKYQYLHLKE